MLAALYALKHRHLKRGIATLCLGGGNGVALAVEEALAVRPTPSRSTRTKDRTQR